MKGIKLSVTLLLMLGLLLGSVAAGSAAEDTSIIKIGSDVVIEAGQKVRNVVTIGGQITVSGAVENNITAVGGSVVLTKTASVGGNVVSLGGIIVMARDSQVSGNLTEINSSNIYDFLTTAVSAEWEGWSWLFAVISLAIFLVILVLALLIVALLPKPVRTVADAIVENTFKVTLCGILGLILIAPLALLLTISVVGIALIPLEVIIVVCSILLGFIAVGQIIGRKVYQLLKRPNPGMVRETFWGLIILWLIGWLPYIGWMAKAVAIVIGLGAALVTRFGTYQGWKCTPPSAAAGSIGGGVLTPSPPQPSGPNGEGVEARPRPDAPPEAPPGGR